VSASATSGRIGFSWIDDVGTKVPKGVYLRIFTNPGGWGATRLLSCLQVSGSCSTALAPRFYNDAYAPSVALFGSTGVGIAWTGCPVSPTTPTGPCNGTPSGGNQDPGAEILWKESPDNGATWSAGEGYGTGIKVVSSNDGPSSSVVNGSPSIAFDTQAGSSGGCAVVGGFSETGCIRYVVYYGHDYSSSTSRVYLATGTQG